MKIKNTLLLLLLFAGNSFASSFSGSLLWKISGNGLEDPSYVLGTHHLLDKELLDSIPGFAEAFSAVKQVIGEVKASELKQVEASMQQYILLPEESDYKDFLETADYDFLDAALRELTGGGLDMLGRFKPAMISNMVAIILYSQITPGYNLFSHVPIDVYIQDLALEQGKKNAGLETAEEQFEILFNTIPYEEQAKELVCLFNHLEESKEMLVLLNQYYRQGLLAEMYELSYNNETDPCPFSPVFMDLLLNQRNQNWLSQLPALMEQDNSMIVVGALHLAGPEGILQKLHEMGYKVEAVHE